MCALKIILHRIKVNGKKSLQKITSSAHTSQLTYFENKDVISRKFNFAMKKEKASK